LKKKLLTDGMTERQTDTSSDSKGRYSPWTTYILFTELWWLFIWQFCCHW